MNQFIVTKGEPVSVNENYEDVSVEPLLIEEYNCKLYKYEERYGVFYQIWFIEDDRCTILEYANFNEVIEISEEEMLKESYQLPKSVN